MYLIRIAVSSSLMGALFYLICSLFIDRPQVGIASFFGGCTGILVGAIVGATRSILVDLPDAMERSRYVRKIRDLESVQEQKSFDQ